MRQQGTAGITHNATSGSESSEKSDWSDWSDISNKSDISDISDKSGNGQQTVVAGFDLRWPQLVRTKQILLNAVRYVVLLQSKIKTLPDMGLDTPLKSGFTRVASGLPNHPCAAYSNRTKL
ncbi:hypothetical protein LBMAG46_27010 [Planctomycetia bacterium]|nr:hypothetical protein LBMAG46_27010 [Planctomycetia bacterium]